MKAICYKQVQQIKQNSIHCESKTQSGIRQRSPLGLLTIIRCSFYVTADLEDFQDKDLIRVELKATILKENTITAALTIFGINTI